MSIGYLALVLHAHLPFVRHPEYSFFLEEEWLYEAITETYVPLINVYDGLINDGVPFKITMTMTPPLISMLADPLLQGRYVHHIDQLIELAEKEVERTKFDGHFNYLARYYLDRFRNARYVFAEKYQCNLINAFKKFQDLGHLEIITCGATHGFLPLLRTQPESVKAQIHVAANHYERHFGCRPRGIWLPECGYFPGVDEVLREAGIRYFFTDTHGVLYANPRPRYGVFSPIFCTGSGVAAFGRDKESSKQVWSSKEGYPGDVNYRDFYRDIGYDLEFDYIAPYIQPDGTRKNTGIKYYRVTGDTNNKEPYDPYWADQKCADHAANFMFNREKQVEHLFGVMGKKPIIISPYDAELFGHWWFEGPQFLNYFIRKVAYDQSTFELTTAADYLKENPTNQVATPSYSSWGDKGYAEFWCNGTNDWIYPHLHKAAERMVELARHHQDNGDQLKQRALNQAARELLLAQSSDWAFIMTTGTMVEYAVKRTKSHLLRFNKLYEDVKNNRIDDYWLGKVEYLDNIFPEINYQVYA